jgi:cell division protein FtsB
MSFLPLIMLAIPVLFIFLFVRRAKRLIRVMQNPEQLGQLLSQSVRAALAEAGLDPDRLELAQLRQLEDGPALQQRIRSELHVVFKRLLSARAGDLLPSTVGASPMVAPVSLSGTAAVMNRPLPIDHASRRRSPVPVVAIAVIAAAVAVAFLVR